MLSLRILPRGIFSFVNNQKQNINPTLRLRLSTKNDSSSSSSESSDSDSDNEKTQKFEQDPTINNDDNLKNLLNKMITKQPVSKTINVAKPKKSMIPEVIKAEKEKKMGEKEKFQNKLFKAAEDVATSMGKDVEQTKKDLLFQNMESSNTKLGRKKVQFSKKQSDEDAAKLMNVLMGMDIKDEAKSTDPIEKGRAERAKKYTRTVFAPTVHTKKKTENYPLYTKSSNYIFKSYDELHNNQPKCEIWDMMEQRELKAMLLTPPRNYFEEMIQWTEKGMIWKFPIDNEQDMKSEDNVHFSDHVFLERHLEGWCPKKGPIRHFMELVCVGLSKNAFLKVEEKIDHIMWYRDYFTGKEGLLKELGALPEGHTFGASISDGEKSQPLIKEA